MYTLEDQQLNNSFALDAVMALCIFLITGPRYTCISTWYNVHLYKHPNRKLKLHSELTSIVSVGLV